MNRCLVFAGILLSSGCMDGCNANDWSTGPDNDINVGEYVGMEWIDLDIYDRNPDHVYAEHYRYSHLRSINGMVIDFGEGRLGLQWDFFDEGVNTESITFRIHFSQTLAEEAGFEGFGAGPVMIKLSEHDWVEVEVLTSDSSGFEMWTSTGALGLVEFTACPEQGIDHVEMELTSVEAAKYSGASTWIDGIADLDLVEDDDLSTLGDWLCK